MAYARRLGARTGILRLKKDEKGATAIEFAAVAVPFFMFVFGLIGTSLYFFLMTSLDRGMDTESRLIRTGQAQTANMTVKQFKQELCAAAGGDGNGSTSKWINCSNLSVFVQKFASWDLVATQPCLTNGKMTVSSAKDSDLIAQYSGGASDIVLVTVCYKWSAAAKIPFINLGTMKDGSMMMQTATAFRTEPYSTTP